MKPNRSAVWLLVGIVVGFGLPVLALIGVVFALVLSSAQLAGQTGSSLNKATYLSGPESGPAVVLLDLVGPIISGKKPVFDTQPIAAAGDIVPLIRQIDENADIKALVLRINSPGGSVVGSDEIYHALQEMEKPIVVLMQEVAASGGYYISMAAGFIVVNPNTITGSIGVIGQFPNAEKLVDKIGFEMTTIKSGKSKDIGNPFRAMTVEEKAIFQDIVDETYGRFVGIVATGRNLPEAQVRELADGRVYTGQKALELGLVDALGYQRDAVSKAAELAGIEGEPRLIHYKDEATFFEMLVGRGWTGLAAIPGLPYNWIGRMMAPSLEFRWEP
jgi:protease-4